MNPEPPGNHRTSPDRDRPGVPRWVKVSGFVGAAIVVMVVVLLLAGHGPGRHGQHGLGAHTSQGPGR